MATAYCQNDFYPRPPRGGRLASRICSSTATVFLSTPSARRATVLPDGWEVDDPYFYPRPPRGGRLRHSSKLQQNKGYFYPRPPRGGRPLALSLEPCDQLISIHALREEGDQTLSVEDTQLFIFLSTPSARRATRICSHGECVDRISIHALREEGDSIAALANQLSQDFYPRPPRGGRLGFPRS